MSWYKWSTRDWDKTLLINQSHGVQVNLQISNWKQNGDGMGKTSFFFVVMKGQYDEFITSPWDPANKTIVCISTFFFMFCFKNKDWNKIMNKIKMQENPLMHLALNVVRKIKLKLNNEIFDPMGEVLLSMA